MTPQELKNSILQLAIQGKLVEQRAEEGTGEELYQRLLDEKNKLSLSGALKGRKNKPLLPIDSEDSLFEIPESWAWIRLGNVVEIFGRIGFRGYTKNDIVDKDNGAITISPSNIKPNGKTDFEECTYISWEKYEESPEIMVCNGDIILVKTGSSYGKCAIVHDLPEKATINPQLAILKYVTCCSEFLNYALKSPMARGQFESFVIGTSIPTFSQEKLANLLLPLPPLAEQKRIVAKIEELLPYINRYEKAWSKLENFNKRFPVDMQKSILQIAIQGKLVEQRPGEGTAEDLYRQIQAEKQALIKSGTIKKEKPLPEITEDELPFDIPESWKWVRLQNLCSLIGDIDHNMPKAVNAENGVAFLSAKDLLDDGSINYTENVKYISFADFDRLSRKAKPQRSDIIYSRIGACLGKARVVETDMTFLVSYSCCVIRPIAVDPRFLRYYLESPLIMAHSVKARQSIGVPDLGMGEIKKYLVALPPLAEQKRIVAKLEEILPLCERLK